VSADLAFGGAEERSIVIPGADSASPESIDVALHDVLDSGSSLRGVRNGGGEFAVAG
jgi:hypothetical protein